MGTEQISLAFPFSQGRGVSVREFVAAYATKNKERVRAIARRKLPRSTRRVVDSDEVFSSVLRRLDLMALRGTLRLDSERELWGLIEAMASNTAVSKVRLIERAHDLLTEDSPYAYELLRRLNACGGDDEATLLLLRMTASLKSPADRHILVLMHRGASHRAIAHLMGISEEASRQRWRKIRGELCERFRGGDFDG